MSVSRVGMYGLLFIHNLKLEKKDEFKLHKMFHCKCTLSSFRLMLYFTLCIHSKNYKYAWI